MQGNKTYSIWLTILLLLFVVLACCWYFLDWCFKSISENSTVCMDKVQEYIEETEWWFVSSYITIDSASLGNLFKKVYIYEWTAKYSWKKYSFSCEVEDGSVINLDWKDEWDDEYYVCHEKYKDWLKDYDSSNNESFEGVDFEYDAEIFYSSVVEGCVWYSIQTVRNSNDNRTEIIYDIYDLDHEESLFHDREDTDNLSDPSEMSIEEFLADSSVKKDFQEKMTYFWFWENVEDIESLFNKNLDTEVDEYVTIVEKEQIETSESRENVCSERVGYYLNYNTWNIVWADESEWWASFYRDWHVHYNKWWESAEDDVTCFIDMVDSSVHIQISNHIYNGLDLSDDELNEFAAQALPCDEWKTFSLLALFSTSVNDRWNTEYYWVVESLGYLPEEWELKNTCYRISPLSMEVVKNADGYSLWKVSLAEDAMPSDVLLEDYNPVRDWTQLDERVKEIFSEEAFKIWQQRDYWEYFLDYENPDRKSFDERAMEYYYPN